MCCTHLVHTCHIGSRASQCLFHLVHGHNHAHCYLSVLFFCLFTSCPSSSSSTSSSFVHDSMKNHLCHPAIGSMVTFDYCTPDTRTKLRGNDILLLYRKLLTTSTTQSYMKPFNVTHFAGCTVLFNSPFTSTTPDVQNHIVEGEHVWFLEGVVSRASFRRVAASGQTAFTV